MGCGFCGFAVSSHAAHLRTVRSRTAQPNFALYTDQKIQQFGVVALIHFVLVLSFSSSIGMIGRIDEKERRRTVVFGDELTEVQVFKLHWFESIGDNSNGFGQSEPLWDTRIVSLNR